MRRLTIGVLIGTFLSLAAGRRRRAAAIVRQAAARAKTARAAEGGSAGSARPRSLEDLTKEELYHRAQEEDIPGRSHMSKDELIKALRQAHGR